MQFLLSVLPTALQGGTWVLSPVPVQKEPVLGEEGRDVRRKLGALPCPASGLGGVWAPSPLAPAWSPQVPAQWQGHPSSCLLLTCRLIHVDFFESRYREKSFQNGDTDVLLQEPGALGVCLGLHIPRGAFPWHSSWHPVEMLVKEARND